ncbi:hypothetical protein ABID74_001289 [Gordonia terrae]
MPSITEFRDTLIGLSPPSDDGTGRAVLDRLDELRVLRNVLDHQIDVHVALVEASGAAARAGSTTRSWLIEMGMPPAVAHRGVRIAGGLASLPKLADCAAEGYLAVECVDAVVRGIALINRVAAAALSDGERQLFETELLTQAFSGATPAEIDTHSRSIAMRVAEADPGTVSAADDASLNTLHTRVTDEGRVAITGDVTAVIGDKFLSMIDERSCPRPEPDGAEDRRSVGERRALLLPEVRAKRASKGLVRCVAKPFEARRPRRRGCAVADGDDETTVPAPSAPGDHRPGCVLCEMWCPRCTYAGASHRALG